MTGMIGIVIWPAIAVSRCHPEQVPHRDRLAARGRGVGQRGQVRQDGVVQAEHPVAFEHAHRK
jgi:hypothetical protein